MMNKTILTWICMFCLLASMVFAACIVMENGNCYTSGVDIYGEQLVDNSDFDNTILAPIFEGGNEIDHIVYGKVCEASRQGSGYRFRCASPEETHRGYHLCAYLTTGSECAGRKVTGTNYEECPSWAVRSSETRDDDAFCIMLTEAGLGGCQYGHNGVGLAGFCGAESTEGYNNCGESDIDEDGFGRDCSDETRACRDGVETCEEVSVLDELCRVTPAAWSEEDGFASCMNFCVDEDHDKACAGSSARFELDPESEEGYPGWYVDQANHYYYDLKLIIKEREVWSGDTLCEDIAKDSGCCDLGCCVRGPGDFDVCAPGTECRLCEAKAPDYIGDIGEFMEEGSGWGDINERTEHSSGEAWLAAGQFITRPDGTLFFDCDDNNSSVTPFRKEERLLNSCNLIDDDCDGEIDECTSEEYKCIYKSEFLSCHDWDSDDDGYLNASFGCPLCTDCDDSDPEVNPAADDPAADDGDDGKDNNCNGVVDEMADRDGDRIPDLIDYCDLQGRVEAPINHEGCWYSTYHDNLDGWSVE